APRAPARSATARCSWSDSTRSSASVPARSAPMRSNPPVEAHSMKLLSFSGWKTRAQVLGLALLVGVAGLTGTFDVLAQDATSPVAEAVAEAAAEPTVDKGDVAW